MKMNQLVLNTAMISGLIMAPASVWAQQSETYRHGYGHMSGWGGGWHGTFLGPLFMIVVLVVVITLVVLLVRWLGGSWQGPQTSQQIQSGPSPLDILKERFARGEINTEEYEERRKVLGD